jgi:SHS family lactate transporter-like MFS transporter
MASNDRNASSAFDGTGDYTEHNANMHPPHHGMSTGKYLATRVSSLKPPMSKAPNPFRLMRMLNRHQWAFFFVAFFAWVCMFRTKGQIVRRANKVVSQTWDAFDFFTVSLTVSSLATTFKATKPDITNTDITWGITLVSNPT